MKLTTTKIKEFLLKKAPESQLLLENDYLEDKFLESLEREAEPVEVIYLNDRNPAASSSKQKSLNDSSDGDENHQVPDDVKAIMERNQQEEAEKLKERLSRPKRLSSNRSASLYPSDKPENNGSPYRNPYSPLFQFTRLTDVYPPQASYAHLQVPMVPVDEKADMVRRKR